LRDRVAALLPKRALLEQRANVCSSFGTFGSVRNFDVLAKDHDAFPIVVSADVVGFDTDERVLAHPFNLLSDSRKPVKSIRIETEIDRHDVGAIVATAGQPPESESNEQFSTFLRSHFGDDHLVIYVASLHHLAPVRRRR
jgi:hypothetical protein